MKRRRPPSKPVGPVFTGSFAGTSLTTFGNNDAFVLTAGSSTRVAIREVRLSQTSDFGDAEAEQISVYFGVGSTSTGGGSSITPQNLQRHSGAPSPASSLTGPSTTLASTTSVAVVWTGDLNVAAGLLYRASRDEQFVIEPSDRFTIRLGTPNDALTAHGTIVFEELGKSAVEASTGAGAPPSGPSGDARLTESGDFRLKENGDFRLLE